MELVCTNCNRELATVEVLYPFSASVNCGECGATVGHKMEPDPAAAVPLSPAETLAAAESELDAALQKVEQLKSKPVPSAASAKS
jgi:hypothetical protein